MLWSLDVQSDSAVIGAGDSSDDSFNLLIVGVTIPHGCVTFIFDPEHLEAFWIGLDLNVPSCDCASGSSDHHAPALISAILRVIRSTRCCNGLVE